MSELQVDKRPVSSADYLIIGGGVAGCALTYALSKRGVGVTLLEGGEVGAAGASSVPVALLNPFRGRSARASELDLAGLAAMRRLADELEAVGLAHGIHQNGVLRIASSNKQAKTWRKRDGVRWLESEEVPAVYNAPFGGFLVEGGGWLEPQKLLSSLITAAERNGANVMKHCEVEEVCERGSHREVKTSRQTVQAQTIIFCTGTNSEFSTKLGVAGLEHVAGEVIGLKTDVHLPHALAGAIYGAKRGEHVYLGGNHRAAEQTDESAPQQLQRAGSWFIPALKGAERVSSWSGVRAKAQDNMPIVQEVHSNMWFFGALAGRGFLSAAHLAENLAEQLTREA